MCKRIGLTPDRIQSTERSVAELAYANYLQINASRDNWFSLHVIMIACAYVREHQSQGKHASDSFAQGWSKIAKKLYDEGSTDKNSEFYKEWILVNIDTSDSVNNADFFSSDARKLSSESFYPWSMIVDPSSHLHQTSWIRTWKYGIIKSIIASGVHFSARASD